MHDLIDLIFEKYSEGKFSEDKLLLLLEANKTTDNKNNDKEELAKKKKAVAKKIAATLLLIAGISAIIVLCRKNGDTDGEKKLSDIQKNLNKDVKEAKSDLLNAKTVSEVNAVEAKVNNVEKKATSVKRYKVIGDKKLPSAGDYKQAEYKTKDIKSKLKPKYLGVSRTEMGKLSIDTKKLVRRYNRIQNEIDRYNSLITANEHRIKETKEEIEKTNKIRNPDDTDRWILDTLKTQYNEFLRRNEEYADKLKEYKDELKQTPEMRTIAKHINKKIDMISDKNEKYNKKLISQNKEWKQKWDGKKLHLVRNSVDDIISDSYKYLYMIESVVERYDRDIITYESTMDLIDTICVFEASNTNKEEIKRIKEKIKKKEKLTEAEKKKYEMYKKSRNEKIGMGVGAVAAGIATVAAANHIANKSVENDIKRQVDNANKELDERNKAELNAIDEHPDLYTKHGGIDSKIMDQESYIETLERLNARDNKQLEELSKNKFKNRNTIRKIQDAYNNRIQRLEKAKAQITELKKRKIKYQNM